MDKNLVILGKCPFVAGDWITINDNVIFHGDCKVGYLKGNTLWFGETPVKESPLQIAEAALRTANIPYRKIFECDKTEKTTLEVYVSYDKEGNQI